MKRATSTIRRSAGAIIGFLMFLGVLGGHAWADAVSDALECRAELAREEVLRDRCLLRADSLGSMVEDRSGDAAAPARRAAELVQREAMDRELEILVRRDRCRRLAELALASLDPALVAVQDSIAQGLGFGGTTARLMRMTAERADLRSSLVQPAILSYADLAPDSTDTDETLRAKLEYYEDVRSYLDGVLERLEDRVAELRKESRVLEEASRFLRDLDFADEGGRVSSDGAVRLRNPLPGGSPDDGGMSRTAGSVAAEERSGSLEFALHANPSNREESERLTRLLGGHKREIKRELEKIARKIELFLAYAPQGR